MTVQAWAECMKSALPVSSTVTLSVSVKFLIFAILLYIIKETLNYVLALWLWYHGKMHLNLLQEMEIAVL